MEQGPFINYVTVTTSSVKGLSTSPIWTADATPSEDFELALGQGYEGPVTVNLANIPHILLGGSTGSGKTVLLKCLIAQAIQKHAVVHIADFKGRVDFPYVWDNYCDFYLDETSLLQELIDLVNCLEWRKAEFRKHSVANIDAYNSTTGSHLQRHILACDEIAEFLDMRGLDKEHKDLVYQIINRLSVIARQGRAFGIHLILATQRPDADILPGQIKNNLDCRICGRADRILSQIILDNSDAASAIPKDSRGRFLMNDGTEFQGYYMDDIPMAAELDSYRNAHKFD